MLQLEIRWYNHPERIEVRDQALGNVQDVKRFLETYRLHAIELVDHFHILSQNLDIGQLSIFRLTDLISILDESFDSQNADDYFKILK